MSEQASSPKGTSTCGGTALTCEDREHNHQSEPEPRYTMDEAVAIIRAQACEARGHTFTVVTNAGNDPVKLLCTVCGKQGLVDWPDS